METVIERAEELLQRLKTPCAPETDTSSSFHTPDSRESNATISMVSDIESSFAEETNASEQIIENVETRLVIPNIHEKQADLESQYRSERSIQCEKEYLDKGCHLNSPPRLDEVVQHLGTSSTNKCHDSPEESHANMADSADKGLNVSSEEILAQKMAERNSLEGWVKVAEYALRGWHGDAENVDTSSDNDPEIRPSVNRNLDNGKRETSDVRTMKNNLQDNVVNSPTISAIAANCRSPLTILEEYAKRCEVPIKYDYKPKSNRIVINGDLCGFRAMSCAETQDLAKNKLAAKILWMVAERQMDGTKLSTSICGLSDLSREEMLEILELNKGELKNASQKIYKLCLEKGAPIPEYSICSLNTSKGFTYKAQCVALGYVETGQGVRVDGAKIAAAENLYRKYTHEVEQQTT